jgi:hypothetical protein
VRKLIYQAVVAGVFLGAMALQSYADSIEPDLKKILREAEKPKQPFVPARVGWNGPEVSNSQHSPNPIYERLRPATPDAVRAELLAVLIPDWRIFAAFAVSILGIRLLKSSIESQRKAAVSPAAAISEFPVQALQHVHNQRATDSKAA